VALFEPFFAALNRAEVRYVVVGGFAVVLHGYARLTGDVDLAIDLEPAAARHAIETFVALGLRPRAPVNPHAFADPAVRQQWAIDRNMHVFSLWDPTNPMREVDVFVENPLSFEDLWSRAETVPLESTTVRVASIADLIAMKRMAGRPQDRADIEALEALARRRS
jgi:hypothetical protein